MQIMDAAGDLLITARRRSRSHAAPGGRLARGCFVLQARPGESSSATGAWRPGSLSLWPGRLDGSRSWSVQSTVLTGQMILTCRFAGSFL